MKVKTELYIPDLALKEESSLELICEDQNSICLFFGFWHLRKSLRPLANHRAKGTETSLTTHNKEHSICKKYFGKVIKQNITPALKNQQQGTSLVVQWLRMCLPMQGR